MSPKGVAHKRGAKQKSGEKGTLIMRPLRRKEDRNARKTKIIYNLEWV